MIVESVISAVLTAAGPVLERFFPDPAKRREFELAMRQIDVGAMRDQLEINKIEAASSSRLGGRLRPRLAVRPGAVLGLVFDPLFARYSAPDHRFDRGADGSGDRALGHRRHAVL
jgi:hypothetical protein